MRVSAIVSIPQRHTDVGRCLASVSTDARDFADHIYICLHICQNCFFTIWLQIRLWNCFHPLVHPSSYGEGGVTPLPGCPIYSDAARYTCLSQNGYGLKFLIRTNIWLISTILMYMVIHGCCFLFFMGVGEPLPSALLLHNAPTQGKQ